MNSRARQYFKAKKYTKNWKPTYDKIHESFFLFNAAATHTSLDEQGNVRVRVLGWEEMQDLLEKERAGKVISEEITIARV